MRRHQFAAVAATIAAFALTAGAASAASLNVTYYSHGTDLDFGTQCCSNSTDLVLSKLGPDGLPVYNTAANNNGFVLHDLTGVAGNEINWWNGPVTGSGTVTLPINNNHMFLPDASNHSGNDGNGYLTAIFKGQLVLPTDEAFTFNLRADDDAFVYIDGNVVDQLGGVHPVSGAPVTTSSLSKGTHDIEIFYADRDTVAAELDFSVLTEGVRLSGVPEPGSWALMLGGVGAVGLTLRQRRRAAPVTTA